MACDLERAGLGAYANRLTPAPENFVMAATTAPQAMRRDMSPERYVDCAKAWAALGAELVGGCCGIGPEYIEALQRGLVEPGAPGEPEPEAGA